MYVALLIEMKNMRKSGDFNAKEVANIPKVSKSKMGAKLRNDMMDLWWIAASNENIIHID